MIDQLLEDNYNLIRWAANRFSHGVGKPWLLEDFEQAAAEGFVKAFKKRDFDPDKGTISTFAYPHMFRQMQQLNGDVGQTGHSVPFHLGTRQKELWRVGEVQSLDIEQHDGIHYDDYDDIEAAHMIAQVRSKLPEDVLDTFDALLKTDLNISATAKLLSVSRHKVLTDLETIKEYGI